MSEYPPISRDLTNIIFNPLNFRSEQEQITASQIPSTISKLKISSSQDATDKDSGALILLNGGLGVEKQVYSGTNIIADGDLRNQKITTSIFKYTGDPWTSNSLTSDGVNYTLSDQPVGTSTTYRMFNKNNTTDYFTGVNSMFDSSGTGVNTILNINGQDYNGVGIFFYASVAFKMSGVLLTAGSLPLKMIKNFVVAASSNGINYTVVKTINSSLTDWTVGETRQILLSSAFETTYNYYCIIITDINQTGINSDLRIRRIDILNTYYLLNSTSTELLL